MPEHSHMCNVHFVVVHLHIVTNLARTSDPIAAVVPHFIVILSVALSNCQPHSVSEMEFPHTLPAW